MSHPQEAHDSHPLNTHVLRLKDHDYLKSYVREALKFPMITQDEEIQLAKDWHEQGNKKSMEKLMNSHLKLVVRIANGYRGYGMNMGDMIAEGNIGMMQAIKGFDASKGFRFSTYASWWIQASIKDYIIKNWSLVKIGTTKAQKKLFFGLRRLKNKLAGQETHLSDETIKTISQTLSVSEKDVKDMNERLYQDYSLNARISTDEEGEWQDWLSNDIESHEVTLGHQQELEKRQELLKKSLGALPERDYHIFVERRLKEPPKTLAELSDALSLSRERIRQIEVSAFHALQKDMHKHAAILT